MSDPTNATFTDDPQGQAQPMFRVLGQYVKDLSFENPDAPNSLRSELDQPKIDVALDVQARQLTEASYESWITIRVNSKRDGKVVFIAELTYAGLFHIQNMPPEAMQPILLIQCPRLLFPFARQILGDAVRDGGFPPLLLEPIDFEGLYQSQHQAPQPQAESAAS